MTVVVVVVVERMVARVERLKPCIHACNGLHARGTEPYRSWTWLVVMSGRGNSIAGGWRLAPGAEWPAKRQRLVPRKYEERF